MKKLGVCLLLLLSGCATVGKFEAKMDAKKGLTKDQLLGQMGIPDREYKGDNYEIIEYYRQGSIKMPTNTYATVTQNSMYPALTQNSIYSTTSGGNIDIDCRLSFRLVNNVVQDYSYKGAMCTSN